jgi:hypothetical protein
MNANPDDSVRQTQISPRTVHALAQLMLGIEFSFPSENGFPEDWRRVIERLIPLPLVDRPTALEAELLAVMPELDREKLLNAIFACDPRVPFEPEAPTEPATTPFPPYIEGKSETESRRVELISVGAILDQRDVEIRWAVDRLIPEGGVAIMGGPAGYGKTWTLLDLAIETARGGDWLGRFRTAKGGVLYFDEESALALLRFRLHRLIAGKHMPASELDLHFGVGQGICLDDPSSLELLRRELAAHNPKLVIFDSLIRVNRADENSASEMAKVFAIVKKLVRDYGCTIVFADHQRKPGHMSTSQDMLLRGSSDKLAFIDTLLSLHKREDKLIIEHSKSRYGMAVPSFVIEIVDAGPMATTVAYVGEADEMRRAAKQDEAKAFLKIALAGGDWVPRKDLVAQAEDDGISTKALDATLKEMTEVTRELQKDMRKPETGRGGRSAHYRRRQPEVIGDLNPGRACAELERMHAPEDPVAKVDSLV